MQRIWRTLLFFFGTPLRGGVTGGVFLFCTIVEHFKPGLLGGLLYKVLMGPLVPIGEAVGRVLCEVFLPLLEPVLTLVIVVFGLRVMFGGLFRKKK